MMKIPNRVISVALVFCLLSCSATQTKVYQSGSADINTDSRVTPIMSVTKPPTPNAAKITLEKIMSDPDWLGRQPESASWSLDSNNVIYQRKRQGSHLRDTFVTNSMLAGNGDKAPLSVLQTLTRNDEITSVDNQYRAWIFENNIFVHDYVNQQTRQLTKDSDSPQNLVFLVDKRIAYRVENTFYAIDLSTGLRQQVIQWRYADKPTPVKPAEDFIAKEQIELIDYIALRRQQRQEQAEYDQQLQQGNLTLTGKPVYLPKNLTNVVTALSPKGDYLVVVATAETQHRKDSDIMPNYIQEDGRIAAQPVRRRVSDSTPLADKIWLIDVKTSNATEISLTSLAGYNDDVLADVKRENAEAIGEDYIVNRLPRDIHLLRSWYAQAGLQWHPSGDAVALQLEAWDNKDRWLVTLDLDDKRLITQHRLSDEAWVNYRFNQYGWLNQSLTLYYLSEETGYSHLYVKPLNGESTAVTQGRYVVDAVTISQDDNTAFFKANIKHPGIYEVYQVNLDSTEVMPMTDLNGMTDYVLSPDESSLLLTHSKLTMPPELYLLKVGADSPTQVTHTVSDAFLSMPWISPSIVAVPSSHAEQPIYSRVYLPQDSSTEKRRAVVFNHGAGYLQNSHMGWSGYFREFMFHSMLVQQGYVVMDMDYRASAGYGRDWRTAIYRQMGTPETQDLVDGVNWMVENVNVDRHRIGTYGGSYGGFMTFMALFTEPDLFQAGAALRPVSDWAHYNHGYTSNILNTPNVDPIAYRRSSPIYFAEGLEKPLLINAPMIDDNVFFVDVVRLVQRLIELEKHDFETAIYPVEPHGFVQPSSWLDEYRRIYRLFEDNL
jgi:dipeptidyl aminopeptidase/acylaminoacyl peptidase